MARQKAKKENNTFVKGLITEAGPLTFPENASIIDVNFVLNRDGSRQRRLGMSYENDFVKRTISSLEGTINAVKSYTWKSVGVNSALDIAVLQISNSLYFFDNNRDSISSFILNGGVPLVISSVTETKYNFTSIYGKLIVATGEQVVYILEYDETTEIISESVSGGYRLEIRDTFGVQEVPALEVDERPQTGVLSPSHNYNLRNQGWPFLYSTISNRKGDEIAQQRDPVTWSNIYPLDLSTDYHFFPSNADTITALKTVVFQNVSATGAYNPREAFRNVFGTTPAPKGLYTLDLFNRGESRATRPSGVTFPSLPTDKTLGGITDVNSYAGRVFYAVREDSTSDTDENSPNIGTMIMFGQSTSNISDLGKCYSENDPTSPEINDPLATDGGFITIANAGKIERIVPLGESLFVFTSKGVWEISGGEGFFSATNQTVTKTTDFGTISGNSIVEGETGISFWSPGDIYSIQIDPTSLKGVPTNLTRDTIHTFYEELPSTFKEEVTGIYDDVSKHVRWLYCDAILPYRGYYNKELVLDLALGSFYINDLKDLDMTTGASPYVMGYLNISDSVFTDITEQVVVGTGNNVQVTAVDVGVTLRESDQSSESSTKYWAVRDLGTGSAEFTVAGYLDLDFLDWPDETDSLGVSGQDANATLLTGYTTDGDSELEKKNPRITVFMKRTETGFTDDGSGNLTPINPSSCLLQGQWEWTDSATAGRWSPQRDVYRLPRMFVPTGSGDPFDYSFTVVKTNNRIRGKGSALSLLFKTSPGMDLHIYGWTREILLPET